MINESIAKLVKYGENAGLVSGLDKIYATNRILEVMQISDYEEPEQIPETPDLEETLNELLDDAAKRGLLEHNSVVYRDLFDTKLMDCLMPRPGEVVKKFEELYAKSPQEATDYFYKLSQDSDYIRRYRVCKDQKWVTSTPYGDLDITINLSKPEKDPKAIAAAKLANADSFITRLPDGYNTMLTGNGASLSQGQRQLISIARAAVADPPAMILDEATSSIDTRTEALVQQGMDNLMEGRTVLVIAHRLSTIRNSKAIMVLDHGRIIERGDHDDLITQKGTYYQLYTGAFELD